MGYTNTIHGKIKRAENFPLFAKCVRELLKQETESGVKFAGWDGTKSPKVTNTSVSFNGSQEADEDCETCLVCLKNDSGYEFCKTNRNPYDQAVIVTYCLAHLLLGKNYPECDDDNCDDNPIPAAMLRAQEIIDKIRK